MRTWTGRYLGDRTALRDPAGRGHCRYNSPLSSPLSPPVSGALVGRSRQVLTGSGASRKRLDGLAGDVTSIELFERRRHAYARQNDSAQRLHEAVVQHQRGRVDCGL